MKIVDKLKKFGTSLYFRVPKHMCQKFSLTSETYIESDIKVIEQKKE